MIPRSEEVTAAEFVLRLQQALHAAGHCLEDVGAPEGTIVETRVSVVDGKPCVCLYGACRWVSLEISEFWEGEIMWRIAKAKT